MVSKIMITSVKRCSSQRSTKHLHSCVMRSFCRLQFEVVLARGRQCPLHSCAKQELSETKKGLLEWLAKLWLHHWRCLACGQECYHKSSSNVWAPVPIWRNSSNLKKQFQFEGGRLGRAAAHHQISSCIAVLCDATQYNEKYCSRHILLHCIADQATIRSPKYSPLYGGHDGTYLQHRAMYRKWAKCNSWSHIASQHTSAICTKAEI